MMVFIGKNKKFFGLRRLNFGVLSKSIIFILGFYGKSAEFHRERAGA